MPEGNSALGEKWRTEQVAWGYVVGWALQPFRKRCSEQVSFQNWHLNKTLGVGEGFHHGDIRGKGFQAEGMATAKATRQKYASAFQGVGKGQGD